jgi:hypothetical protein
MARCFRVKAVIARFDRAGPVFRAAQVYLQRTGVLDTRFRGYDDL